MTRKRKQTSRQITEPITYKGLAGKIVQRVDSYGEDGQVHFRVRFADKAELVLVVAAQPPKIANAELLRWKDGNMSVARSYTKTRAKTRA